MAIASKENCAVCGAALEYAVAPSPKSCAYCDRSDEALIFCPNGHYVCDSCHRLDATSIVDAVLQPSTSTSPHELLEMLMAHPSVPMHGPEHHIFVPCVLVAAARNAGHPLPERAVEEAFRRGSKVPGGWCGSHGVCGAAAGVGIAVSVITGATPVKGAERTLANHATVAALGEIADGHPRCCKRAGRQAVSAGVRFLGEHLGLLLPEELPIRCEFHRRNNECPREECRYFGAPSAPQTP